MARAHTATKLSTAQDTSEWLPRIDRVVAALLLLVIALAAAATFVVAVGWVRPQQLAAGWPQLVELLSYAQAERWQVRLAVAIGAVVIGLGALALMLRPGPSRRSRRSNVHLLEANEQGLVIVDSRSIASVVEGAALGIPGVIECEAQITGDGTAPLQVLGDVTLRPGIDVKRAGQLVRQRIHSCVEEMVGMPVHDVVVRLHVLEPPELRRMFS